MRDVAEVLIGHTERIDSTRVLTAEAQFVAKMAALLAPTRCQGKRPARNVGAHELWLGS